MDLPETARSAIDRDATQGARQLAEHTEKITRSARADNKLAFSKHYVPQSKRPIVKPRQASGTTLKVPMLLSGLSASHQEHDVSQKSSRLITTDRLHPTSELAKIYQDGTVGGTDAKWRDVELKGYEPGPPVRYMSAAQRTSATLRLGSSGRPPSGSKRNDIRAVGQLTYEETEAGITMDPAKSFLSGFDDSQMVDEILTERNLAGTPGSATPRSNRSGSRPSSGAPTMSEKIGRLMRPRTAVLDLDLPRMEHFRPDARVDAVVQALSDFSKDYPVYQTEESYNIILKSISRDLYSYKLLARGIIPPDIREEGSTEKELIQSIQSFRSMLLKDENDGFLPLEFFDAEEIYDNHSPTEWLTMHQRTFKLPDEQRLKGTPARSRYVTTVGGQTVFLLEPVVVQNYDEETRCFGVQWLPKGSVMLPREEDDLLCRHVFCLRTIDANNIHRLDYTKDSVTFTDCHTVTVGVTKNVKRLNLLFDDEDERIWWQRRWAAHMLRRKIEAVSKLGLFLKIYMERALKFKTMRTELSCYAPTHIPPDFEATPLLEILSDVSGPTSEIIDNIFHKYCLSNPLFVSFFLSHLSKADYSKALTRAEQLVPDVTANIIESNMLASIDYLRRSARFDSSIQTIGLCAPFFITEGDKFKLLTQKRFIATLSGEFLPSQPVTSILRYLKRRCRQERRLFSVCAGYNKAYRLLQEECLSLQCMEGLLLFNVAGVAPFIAQDQICVIKSGIGGGIQADKESYRIKLIVEDDETKPKPKQSGKQKVSSGKRKLAVATDQDEIASDVENADKNAEEKSDDSTDDMTNIPFYAAPLSVAKNTLDLGVVSPGCPFLLDRFVLMSRCHRARMISYLRDTLHVDLSASILLALNEVGIDVYIPNRLLKEYIDYESQIHGYELYMELYGDRYLFDNAMEPVQMLMLTGTDRNDLQGSAAMLRSATANAPLLDVKTPDEDKAVTDLLHVNEIDELRRSIIGFDSKSLAVTITDRLNKLRTTNTLVDDPAMSVGATTKDKTTKLNQRMTEDSDTSNFSMFSDMRPSNTVNNESMSLRKACQKHRPQPRSGTPTEYDNSVALSSNLENDILDGSTLEQRASVLVTDTHNNSAKYLLNGNLLARGRVRDSADLLAFSRLVNMMRYDSIMEVSKNSIFRYMDMLHLFKGSNRISYNSVKEHITSLFSKFSKTHFSVQEAKDIIDKAAQPIFEYVPSTMVTSSLIQLFIDFDAVVRDIAPLDKMTTGTIQTFTSFSLTDSKLDSLSPSKTYPASAISQGLDIPLIDADFDNMPTRPVVTIDEFMQNLDMAPQASMTSTSMITEQQEHVYSRHTQFNAYSNYVENLKVHFKRAQYPTLVGLEFSIFPSISAIESAVYDNYAQIIQTTCEIPLIETSMPCFEGDPYYAKTGTLLGPDPVHSPWLKEKHEELLQYLHESSVGPQCVLEVLRAIYRQLFLVDHTDYIDRESFQSFLQQNSTFSEIDYFVKLMPPLDEFHNVALVEEDVNNEEDLFLVGFDGWDYDFVDSEQQKRNLKEAENKERAQAAKEKHHDHESSEADDADDENDDQHDDALKAPTTTEHGGTGDAREQAVTVKINNTCLSLRDLRSFLLKYTALKELLRKFPPKINCGLYQVDCTKILDIFVKRCQMLRAQVARVIHFRAIGYSNRLIQEWDELRDKMTTDTTTSTAIYAEIRAYVNNIEATVAAMQKRHQILDRYMGVLDEFSISTSDFYKCLNHYEETLVKFALEKSQGQYSKLVDKYKTRVAYLYNTPDKYGDKDLATLYWTVRAKPVGVINSKEGAERRLQEAFAILAKVKDAERADLAELMAKYKAMTVSFAQRANLNEAPQFADELVSIQNYREKIDQKVEVFLLEESQLGFQPSEFKNYELTNEDFQIFKDLWTIVSSFTHNYPMWFSGTFIDLDPRQISTSINEWAGNLLRLQKTLAKIGRTAGTYTKIKDKDRAACCQDSISITVEIIAKLDEFRGIMPLIESLRNPGLKPHHWKEVSALSKSGVAIQPTASLTLVQLIADGFLEPKTLERVVYISTSATKEFAIEKSLDKMTQDWKSVNLDMKYYGKHEVIEASNSKGDEQKVRVYKYYIVKTFDEILLLLDEQFSTLQGMRASAHAAKFEARLLGMEKKLVYLQDIVEEWTRFQRLWMYLEPIFTSDDIKRQLPEESVMFADTCVFWADQSSDAYRSPAAMALAGRDYAVEKFRHNFKQLEIVNKHLSSYLENKRRSFARFFFLSDEELLQILAQTRDPEAVQPHISKCFEGIKSLGFRLDAEGKKEIFSMISAEGEEITFDGAIVPQGDADVWLGEIEKMMKTVLKLLIKQAFNDYKQNVSDFESLEELSKMQIALQNTLPPAIDEPRGRKKKAKADAAEAAAEEAKLEEPLVQTYSDIIMAPREQWITRWPAQVIIVLGQVIWTHETTVAIKKQEDLYKRSLEEYMLKLNYDIDKIVRWVGFIPGSTEEKVPISKNIRALLVILLTLHVHNRDVVAKIQKAFFNKNASIDYSFIWEAELKFKYKLLENERAPADDYALYTKQVNAEIPYAYEYMGIGTRLTITPLTERCYLTLTSAIVSFYGGAPQGPAGTGKTESTKDLAKAIGIQCVVFNCSEGLNTASMGRMFKGLAMSGAWSCFDEFNRIDVEVLSVIAQQILTIQRAISMRQKRFIFEGADISLNSNCAVFITMNPGYAGRAELPDNLKALFRPISMTVPDYSLIAEVMLFACGYRDASKLAVKLCMSLKLSSEQLSKQDHYDFGMRALKSILSAASLLKRLYYLEREDKLCLRALNSVNVPKFLQQDVVLFENIVSDLFPECFADKVRDSGKKKSRLTSAKPESPQTKANNETLENEALLSNLIEQAELPEVIDLHEDELDGQEFDIGYVSKDIDAEDLLRLFIGAVLREKHLHDSVDFIEKTMQLYTTLSVRHGLMNVGRTMSGKSTITDVLSVALGNVRKFFTKYPEFASRFSHEAYPLFYPVQVYKLNAKSITMSELYGSFSDVSNEWSDGIVSSIMRECIKEEAEYRLKWILFDSPVDALWIETMNTVLDDNKKLCLTSGEIITMTANMTIFFEVMDLSQASPATVSRTGMIYCDRTLIPLFNLFVALMHRYLPQWFLALEINTATTWPYFKVVENPNYQPAEGTQPIPPEELLMFRAMSDIQLAGSSNPSARAILEGYPNPIMTCKERLENLFRWLFIPLATTLIKIRKPTIYATTHTMVLTLIKIMASLLSHYTAPASDVVLNEEEIDEYKKRLPPLKDPGVLIDALFVFSLTWSVGSFGDLETRALFGKLFRHLAYDVPAVALANAVSAGATLPPPKDPDLEQKIMYGTKQPTISGFKLGKQEHEAISARASSVEQFYPSLMPDFMQYDIYIWPMSTPIPYTDDEREADRPGYVCLPHDVFITSKTAKQSLVPGESKDAGDTSITPVVLAQSLELQWVPWCNSVHFIPTPEITCTTNYIDTVVPHNDFTSLTAILNILSSSGFPTLLAGPGGSGKSTIVKKLVDLRSNDILLKCCLTANTTSGQLRSIVDSKLEKRRRGVYSFTRGKKAVFFVDDAHMPEKEKYGARPPLEVIRQLLEDYGWYDIEGGFFKRIINMTSIIGCTTNGENIDDILPERLVHHCCTISVPESADESFKTIFTTLIKPLFSVISNPASGYMEPIISASIQLYRNICKEFRPTPAHPHYIFSPRDLSKVFQGIMLAVKNAAVTSQNFNAYYSQEIPIVSLWVHECTRVFADRLVDTDDESKFFTLLSTAWRTCPVTGSHPPEIKTIIPAAMQSGTGIEVYFGGCHAQADEIPYMQLNIEAPEEREKIEAYYYDSLESFNRSVGAVGKMKLVLFKYALVHLIRIARVLSMDRGHALLIGMPSSGKRSLTRLAAASLANYYNSMEQITGPSYVYTRPSSIKILEPSGKSDFIDCIKDAIRFAGVDANPTLLIVQEALADNYGLECINFLVNLGEIPNLWAADEINNICEVMIADLQKNKKEGEGGEDISKARVFEVIADRVVRNMHIVIVTTPESPSLDRLVTSFPSLIGSLSVNWFHPWETDTLRNISNFYLSEHAQSKAITELLVTMHRDVETLIHRSYPSLSASPATFLGILNTFQSLLTQLTGKLDSGNVRYSNGIARLAETEEAVGALKEEQTAKQPILAAAQKEVNTMARNIDTRKIDVGKVKEVVSAEEAVVSKASAEADALAEDCAEELRKAEPLVYRATKALNALKPSDVNEVRSLATPPKLVRFVMDAICIVKGIKISSAPDADNWPIAQKMLRANGFLQSLKSYDAEKMPDAIAATLQKTYLSSSDFDPVAVQKSSIAAAGLCEWVHAIIAYYNVMKDVNPKRQKLALANAEAKKLQDELAVKQKQLKDAEDELSGLEAEAAKAQKELQRLSSEFELCTNRLTRAEGLISGLSGEKVRWSAEIDKLEKQKTNILPTAVSATSFCACLGGIDFADRDSLYKKWSAEISATFPGVEDSIKNFKLHETLAEQAFISRWVSNGLPRDSFSLTSACIAMSSKKVPLLIDPQNQAHKWAATCLGQDMRQQPSVTSQVIRIADPNLHKVIEQCLRTGTMLIIEGISNNSFIRNDARIKAAIVAHNLIMSLTLQSEELRAVEVRFGDSTIEVPPTFGLILVSMCDIHIPPDSFGDFTVVTFKATKEALEDLLLSVAVECEKPELENQRKHLQAAAAEDATTLLTLETQLLNLLSESQNSEEGQTLLDNAVLVNALNETQQRALDISRRMIKAAKTSADIDAARVGYRSLANDASALYFAFQRLVQLDSMYENSLQNFIALFRSVVTAGKSIESADRLHIISRNFAEKLYTYVSRGLFVRHKLAFAFDICLSLQRTSGEISNEQFNLLLGALGGTIPAKEAPSSKLLSSVTDDEWTLFSAACSSRAFDALALDADSIERYSKLLGSSPSSASTTVVDRTSDLRQTDPLAYVIFCACLDRKNLLEAVKAYIRAALGPEFVNTEAANIVDICAEATNTTPVIVLLSPGSDPSNTIMGLADAKSIRVHSVSLGRGQGIIAEKAIAEASINGEWVLLGNTHLAGSWLQRLESICDAISDRSYNPRGAEQSRSDPTVKSDKKQKTPAFEIHKDFRLYLTTIPFPQFPSSITRNSTKVSTEPPLGLKNSVLRLFNSYEEAELSVATTIFKKAEQDGFAGNFDALRATDPLKIAYVADRKYKMLLWNLSLFFSVVLERRRFGTIGFNSPYDWSDPDLHISKTQLLTKFQEIAICDPASFHTKVNAAMAALRFLTAEINVGGRVSDGKDRLCVNSLMSAFYADDLKSLGKTVNDTYGFPSHLSITRENIIEHVTEKWPDNDLPEIYGLDSNAIIFLAQNSGKELSDIMLKMHSHSEGGSATRSPSCSTGGELAQINAILNGLPALFDEEAVNEKYPTNYYQSMNTVLVQECARYNKLLRIMRSTLVNAERVIKGLIIMTKETEGVLDAMRLNQVPSVWEATAWPSVIPLSRWIVDLQERVSFIRSWTVEGVPKVVWFSGFSYPQAFLTGILQNYARRAKIAIDELVFDFQVTSEPVELEHAMTISGLFLQCASWSEAGLADARPNVLFEEMPNIVLIPTRNTDLEVSNRYPCPVYRTSLRRGVLTTTGHSSNYILDVLLPSNEHVNKWIRLGVALFQQKD